MTNDDEHTRAAVEAFRDTLAADGFSGVVAATYGGRPWFEFAGGWSNPAAAPEMRIPNRMETRFATGSVSKMFTAACLARLVDAGLCRFDQPLVEIVPDLRPHFAPEITLAALLSHRSGLGDYIDDDAELPFAGLDVARLDSPQAFLPLVLQVPRHVAGEYRYSSAGYILLGLAIEALTGQSYFRAFAHWVAEPAGLRGTGFPPLDEPSVDMAAGVLPDGRSNVGHLPRVGGPDGGIVTTVSDVQRFFRCLGPDERFLSESSRGFLWQETTRIDERRAYGHGFVILTDGGKRWFGHTGGDPGCSARVALSGDRMSSIIVFSNSSAGAFPIFRECLTLSAGRRKREARGNMNGPDH